MTAFKIDENLPVEVVALLQLDGHDVATVSGQGFGGRPDPDIATVCRAERRAIVSLDTDFANVQVYPPNEYSGIVVLRLRRQDKNSVLSAVDDIRPRLRDEKLIGTLWIVEEGRIRIRE